MNCNGPIIIIEDDLDDQELLTLALDSLDVKNEIMFFCDGQLALTFLLNNDVNPFLILSDINMPKLDGFELRKKIRSNEELNLKCIPYLFFSTSAEQQHIVDAYSESVQGFFVKPHSFEKLKKVLGVIVAYWKECQSPQFPTFSQFISQ